MDGELENSLAAQIAAQLVAANCSERGLSSEELAKQYVEVFHAVTVILQRKTGHIEAGTQELLEEYAAINEWRNSKVDQTIMATSILIPTAILVFAGGLNLEGRLLPTFAFLGSALLLFLMVYLVVRSDRASSNTPIHVWLK